MKAARARGTLPRRGTWSRSRPAQRVREQLLPPWHRATGSPTAAMRAGGSAVTRAPRDVPEERSSSSARTISRREEPAGRCGSPRRRGCHGSPMSGPEARSGSRVKSLRRYARSIRIRATRKSPPRVPHAPSHGCTARRGANKPWSQSALYLPVIMARWSPCGSSWCWWLSPRAPVRGFPPRSPTRLRRHREEGARPRGAHRV